MIAAGAVFVAGLGTVTLLMDFIGQGGDSGVLLALPFLAIAVGVATAPGAVVAWALMGLDLVRRVAAAS